MAQRDAQSELLFRDAQTLTMDSTGDDDISTGVDTAGARAGGFILSALGATLTTQVSYLEILESDTLGGTYTPVATDEAAADKQLPTELNVEYEAGAAWGQLLVNPTSPYRQHIGFVGTKRFVKLRAHTETSQGSVAITVIPYLVMEETPTVADWHPTVDGGDDQP